MPTYIGQSIWDIVNNFSYAKSFINYTFREDMVLDGFENCIKYFHNFNTDKYDNPHAYFTMIANNAFKNRIKIEERERYAKYKTFVESMTSSEINDFMSEEGLQFGMVYDNIYEFIKKFEAKEAVAKAKKREQKKAKKNERETNTTGTD